MAETMARLEAPVLLWFQNVVRNGATDPVVSLFTHLGDSGILWIALCAVLLCFKKTRRAGIAGAFGLVGSLLLTNILIKPIVERPRPWLLIEGLRALVVEKDPHSFPSGHTSAAFAAVIAWQYTLPEKWMRVTAVAAAVLMGLSRLYVGVHYPTDVVCGALVGALCGWMGWKLLQLLEKRKGIEV